MTNTATGTKRGDLTVGEQITIFDWMPQEEPDINTIDEAEAASRVGQALGLRFIYSQNLKEYFAKKGKLTLRLCYGNFNLPDNHDRFVGTGYSIGTSGGGSPCRCIAEAVKWFKDILAKYGE